MWKYDGHDAIRLQVIKVVQKERIVCLRFRREAITGIPCVIFLAIRRPALRIWRVRDHRIHIQRLVGALWIRLIKIRPVLFERVTVSRQNVIREDAAHDEIHTRQVVGVGLQLLCIIADAVGVIHVLRRGLTDVDQ